MNLNANYEKVYNVIKEVKEELRPTKEELEKAYELYYRIKEIIQHALKDLNYEYKVSLEGSLAKGTCIRGDIDLDIFILIKHDKMDNKWIEVNILEKIQNALRGIEGAEVVKKYASHPYLELIYDDLRADIVPAYWASRIDEIKTAVDRTPFHTMYVKSRIASEVQRDEVRLLKKFFKGINVYGAEIKVEGFSGYLCELLIIKYGSFINTLKNISIWRPRTVVVVDDEVKIDEKNILKLFPDAPLIVPDPVDPRRNAAASVSLRSLSTVVMASRTFLREPTKEFFYPRRVSLSINCLKDILRLSERRMYLLLYDIVSDTSPDVLWGELKRVANRLVNILKTFDFEVIDYRLWSDEVSTAVIALELFSDELPKYKVHEGPPIAKLLNSDKFFNKYINDVYSFGPWFKENGRMYVVRRRKFNKLIDVLNHVRGQLNAKHVRLTDVLTIETIPHKLRNNREFNYWLTEVVLKLPFWLSNKYELMLRVFCRDK